MRILHAAALPPGVAPDDTLWIWAEATDASDRAAGAPAPKTRGRKVSSVASEAAVASLPWAANTGDLRDVFSDLGIAPGNDAVYKDATIWMPAWRDGKRLAAVASTPMISEPPPDGAAIELVAWRVPVAALPAAKAVDFLAACADKLGSAGEPESDLLAPGIVAGPSIVWAVAALRWSGALAAQGRYLPDLVEQDGQLFSRWRPAPTGMERQTLSALAAAMPGSFRAVSATDTAPDTAASIMAEAFTGLLLDRIVRDALSADLRSQRGRAERILGSGENKTAHGRWLAALCSTVADVNGKSEDLRQLAAQCREWQQPLSATLGAPFRLSFRLVEPLLIAPDEEQLLHTVDERWTPEAAPVTADADWEVDYLLQANDDPSLIVPLGEVWNPDKAAATSLRRPGFKPAEFAMTALGHASRICPWIESSLRKRDPEGAELDTPGAYAFLTDQAWLLEQAGYGIMLPGWWTRQGGRRKLSSRASVKSPKMQSSAGLTLSSIVEFNWNVALGDQTLSRSELEMLAAQKTGLVRIRGQWVQVDTDEIQKALKFLRKQESGKMSAREAVRLALGIDAGPAGLPVEGIDATGWVAELMDRLEGDAAWEPEAPPAGLRAELRPYQQRGYSWMSFLTRWGLGACLADDMGLGKTVQVIAHLERRRAEGEVRPALVVCPTSVVGNWEREAAKFAPELKVMAHHGSDRLRGSDFAKAVSENAVVISSYALLHRDAAMLQDTEWSSVILDEAQNIKNPETLQSKAARALKADGRIAMTGTPVENHVGDLWALMEFLNPGFLGTQAEFKRRFFTPIQTGADEEASAQLKKLTRPFILRRVKSDKSIIADLPDKIEMSEFCSLTKEQASLYQAVVTDAETALDDDGVEGIQRKGVVLATLAKLKQVCNHPGQFLGDNIVNASRSGKLMRLTEMLEEILSVGERALIFTQFAEMGTLIQRHLQENFGREALFLHGGVAKKQRDRMVERFQSADGPSLFILSLKAGGTGITLTNANHVFHYDRWWNPAVENQATDRAYRIGQKKNVQVHKFVCAGTLEERIDEMIRSKQELAAAVVGTGENWLTELSTSDLKDLFRLRADVE